MRAYELHGVNDLRREDIEKPEIPSGCVLVQVKASGICSSDIPPAAPSGGLILHIWDPRCRMTM